MPEFVVPAESRKETGKNVNRRLRRRGLIPGVLYGTGKAAVPVAVSPREIGAILKSASGENTLFDLDLGGTRRKVILKEFQREPLRQLRGGLAGSRCLIDLRRDGFEGKSQTRQQLAPVARGRTEDQVRDFHWRIVPLRRRRGFGALPHDRPLH